MDKKRGQLRTTVSLILFIFILFISVFAVNQSLNGTNNSIQNDTLNITPDINVSINVFVDITEQDLSLLSGQENPISQDISSLNQTEEAIINESEMIIESQTAENISNKTIEKPILAEFINGKSINTPEVQEYIKWYNNFSSVEFEDVENKAEVSTAIKVGNFNNELKGFVINNKQYAFELLACDERTKSCSFKINGIETDKIYSSEIDNTPKTFSLNDEYEIKINSIKFNFCDNKRFCDRYFEGYDLVDLSVGGR